MAKQDICEDCGYRIESREDNYGTAEHPMCWQCKDEQLRESEIESRLSEQRSDADPGL